MCLFVRELIYIFLYIWSIKCPFDLSSCWLCEMLLGHDAAFGYIKARIRWFVCGFIYICLYVWSIELLVLWDAAWPPRRSRQG